VLEQDGTVAEDQAVLVQPDLVEPDLDDRLFRRQGSAAPVGAALASAKIRRLGPRDPRLVAVPSEQLAHRR